MEYQHRFLDRPCDLPLGKVVCVGRNYAEHAKELNNPVPIEPILFIKPATAVVDLEQPLVIPKDRGECHHETEIAVLIGKQLTKASEHEARSAAIAYGLGLDLTLREVQSKLKEKGHPWEIAKAFDGACPLSRFVSADCIEDPQQLNLQLKVDGQVRQQGNASQMITPIHELIAYISQHFTLKPGDVVMTGTPAGVAPLRSGQKLELAMGDFLFQTRVQ